MKNSLCCSGCEVESEEGEVLLRDTVTKYIPKCMCTQDHHLVMLKTFNSKLIIWQREHKEIFVCVVWLHLNKMFLKPKQPQDGDGVHTLILTNEQRLKTGSASWSLPEQRFDPESVVYSLFKHFFDTVPNGIILRLRVNKWTQLLN